MSAQSSAVMALRYYTQRNQVSYITCFTVSVLFVTSCGIRRRYSGQGHVNVSRLYPAYISRS